MPFVVKNAEFTHQKIMDKVFKEQIVRNIEVYVDDILVKAKMAKKTHQWFRRDLLWRATFSTLLNYILKLNPSKCTFDVQTVKFLGYMITQKGIKVNPKKIQSLATVGSPRNIHEMQSYQVELHPCPDSLLES